MPIKIRETEKEGHRKFRTQEPKRYRGLKSDLYGTKTHKKKPYHDKTTLHKSQRHPHSRLKTQKEYKTITDSSAYKKADYHTQNKMLKKHPTTMKAGGRIGLKEGGGGTYGGWPKGGPSKPRKPKSIRDRLKDWKPRKMPKFPKPESKVSPGRPGGKGKESPDKRWNKGDKFMTPLRAKKAVGGVARKVGKRFLDFIKTGKHVDKHGVKVNVPKAAERLTGIPHVDHGKRKKIKHLGKGKAGGGRAGFQGGGRTNLLEELGRVEAEPSNRNRRAEISRVHGELNRGYKSGGAVLKGKKVGIQIK